MVGTLSYRTVPGMGWSVSAIALGTVELGVEYGLATTGESNRPSAKEAERIVRYAVEMGINLFDTAPAYGESEALLGRALHNVVSTVYVATKVGPFADGDVCPQAVRQSLERSLHRLRRERLDLVQIHNATPQLLFHSPLMDELLRVREEGKIGAIGVSVYGEPDALAALEHPEIAALQVAFSLLDQRMAARVLPLAKDRGVAVLGRSAFLKGVLTERRRHLPPHLLQLQSFSEAAATWAKVHNINLDEAALRFCLGQGGLTSVLVGVSNLAELAAAFSACAKGQLPRQLCDEAHALAVTDEALVDPRTWGIS